MICKTRRAIIRATLQAAEGRFIGLDFIKKDGKRSSLNIHTGVTRHLKANHNKPHLIPVYDMNRGIRSVNLDTVTSVRIDGQEVKLY